MSVFSIQIANKTRYFQSVAGIRFVTEDNWTGDWGEKDYYDEDDDEDEEDDDWDDDDDDDDDVGSVKINYNDNYVMDDKVKHRH